MTNNKLHILSTIDSFEVIQCQMNHEKVATNRDAIPLHKVQDDTIVFNRISLCEIRHRSKRLGCAHSNVNVSFEKVINDLEKMLPQKSDEISVFKNEFKSVIMKIYALDHKVGNLEYDLAICKLNNDNNRKAKLLKSTQFLKAKHSSLMNQLSKIKSDIKQFVLRSLD